MPLSDSIIPTPVDFRRFDLRVARVDNFLAHPVNNGRTFIQKMIYYDEKIHEVSRFKVAINDMGAYYTVDQMMDRLVVLLCNPQPFLVYNIVSLSKMLCAVTDNRLELLKPPPGSKEGDYIYAPGYPMQPDFPFMLPVEKTFETVCVDFSVNSEGQACYKGIPLRVVGREGFLTSETLTDCPIAFQ